MASSRSRRPAPPWLGWALRSSSPAAAATRDRGGRASAWPPTGWAAKGASPTLKREYGGGRSRLKGSAGAKTWAGWTALAYDLDTLARLPVKPDSPVRPDPAVR